MEFRDESDIGYGSSESDRHWAMLLHFSALTGFFTGIGFVLGPIIVFLLGRDRRPSLGKHFRAAMNFHITWWLAVGVLTIVGFILFAILTLITFGLAIPLLVAIAWLMGILQAGAMIFFPIKAGLDAHDGRFYEYPLSIRFFNY